MKALRFRVSGLVLLFGCLGALAACGDNVVVDEASTATAYDGPLDVKVSYADNADVMERSGSAGLALECAGEPTEGGGADYDSGLARSQSSPEKAIENWMSEDGPHSLPEDGYRVEREADGRVLYSFDLEGRSLATIVVSDNISDWRGKAGWGVEAWAACDPSEFDDDFAEDAGVEVWERPDGTKVPTTTLSSFEGAEHCDWQSVTFLTFGEYGEGLSFARDPDGTLSDLTFTPYDADASLPQDAVDSGYEREGRHLWLAKDDTAAYLVSLDDPTDVELWPGLKEAAWCG